MLTADAAALTERAHRWTVFADPAVAVVMPGEPNDPVTAEALRAEPIIGRLDQGDRFLEEHYGLTQTVRHRGATEEQVRMLVRCGIGIGLSTARRQEPGDLAQRRITPPHAVEVCIAAMAGRALSPCADVFLRLARARDWDEAG